MADQDLNIKDIIDKTKNFDQPYAPPIPEGIHEVDIQSFEEKTSNNGYKMLTITVSDFKDRTARVHQMLELQWIGSTIRLIKGLYTKNAEEAEKEAAKEKINKFFDSAKDEADLQKKCLEVIKKLVDAGCVGWLRVEYQNEDDKYPDRALTAYEPTYRWKTAASAVEEIIDGSEEVTVENVENIFPEV